MKYGISHSPPKIGRERKKWDRTYAQYREPATPTPHPLCLRWAHCFQGGPMLDLAAGIGRGLAGAGQHFSPRFALDISEKGARLGQAYWKEKFAVGWWVMDARALLLPQSYFGLVTVFGFTDHGVLKALRFALKKGGVFLYEGFSKRHLEVHPTLNPEWTCTEAWLRDVFRGWTVLECSESKTPPFLLRFAAQRR